MSDVEIGTKRSNGYEDGYDNKRQRNDGNRMRYLVGRMQCGSIIGKGGENIKRLQNEFAVKLHLPDSQCIERVLTMQGDKEACVNVLRELLPSFKESPYTVDPKYKSAFEINFLANTDSVGAVIGKGGEKIREIREQSGGKVKVYQDCLPNSNERIVAIGGDDEACILSAFNIVIDLLENRPPKRPTKFFDPKNSSGGFDDRQQHERNDMPERRNSMGPAPSQMGGPNPMSAAANPLGALAGIGGLSGLTGANILAQLGVNPQVSAALLGGASGNLTNMLGNSNNLGPRGDFPPDQGFNRNQNSSRDDRFSNDRRDDQQGNRDNRDSRSDFSQLTSEVKLTVPHEMCGAIIGRSGQNIKELKHHSGARLDFAKTDKNSKEDRVLTITGTQQQTIAAQRMIADMVMNRDK